MFDQHNNIYQSITRRVLAGLWTDFKKQIEQREREREREATARQQQQSVPVIGSQGTELSGLIGQLTGYINANTQAQAQAQAQRQGGNANAQGQGVYSQAQAQFPALPRVGGPGAGGFGGNYPALASDGSQAQAQIAGLLGEIGSLLGNGNQSTTRFMPMPGRGNGNRY